MLALLLAGLSWLEARQGHADACRAHAEEALALCASNPVSIARVWAEYSQGELALVSGDVPAAVERLSGLLDLLAELDIGDPDVSPGAGPGRGVPAQRPDRGGGRAGRPVRGAAAAKALPWAQARAARLRGLLCGWDELDDRFAEAFALHAADAGRVRVGPDRSWSTARGCAGPAPVGRPRAAARALDCFARLGARPWADLAAVELEADRRDGGPPRRRTSGAALTPRELQIALLLAEGRTTRETAAALFLSPKTVEYTCGHVYTKLGIASRTELGRPASPAPS
jgi:DNA-binding CsgD family transcriptional regulator